MNDEILLEAEQINFKINDRKILNSISFQLYINQCVAILGDSGAGKSTLLKILACQLNPDSGKVYFKGNVMRDPRDQLIRGHQEIKLVNQDFDLDLFHNVEENLRIKLVGYVERIKQKLIDEVLEVVELKPFAKQQVRNLSGGEQQRLALARALILEPDVLLLDEPFVHLDSGLKMRVEHFIKSKMSEWESGVVLVTHDGREAMAWADLIIYLNNGSIQRMDTPSNFYNYPNDEKEALQFGYINKIIVHSREKMFRPNAYKMIENGTLQLLKLKTTFLGTHYEHWFKTKKNEQILLFAQTDLPYSINIEPSFV